MNYKIHIRVNNQLVGVGRASDTHEASSYGLPVIVVTEAGRDYGDHKGGLLPVGVYGPADLPAGSVICDEAANGTLRWTFAKDIKTALERAGYAVG